jgi:hypothetical protein
MPEIGPPRYEIGLIPRAKRPGRRVFASPKILMDGRIAYLRIGTNCTERADSLAAICFTTRIAHGEA